MAQKLFSLGLEDEQTEFKKSTGEMKEAMISIAAILNKHQSGKLYFGVRNDGTVIGQEINDETLRFVSQAIGCHISPTIYPSIRKQQIGDRWVVLVEFTGTQQPYLAYNIPRIRVADEDLVMNQDVYNEMLHRREDYSLLWERRRSKYKISDINLDVFRKYLKRAKEVNRITFEEDDPNGVLTKLGLLDTDGEHLLNAGSALFVDSEMNDLQMAKFASNEKLTFTDIRRQTGSILGLVEVAMQYLIDAMDWRAEFGGLYRREIPEVPIDVLREAVINAFGHRQIESGQSIQIMIFKNRIEIYSPGEFTPKISPEEFAEGNKVAIRRNKLITQTLYYSKDMETFATGLKKIKTLCDEAGVRYEFRREEYGFMVVFYRHCGEGWGWSGDSEGTVKDTNVPHDVPREITTDPIKNTIHRMILQNNKSTREDMAKEAGTSVKTIARKLKEMTDIKYVGSGNNGYWKIDDGE